MEPSNQELIIAYLKNRGFEWNIYRDRMDKGSVGVYFDDGKACVVKFDGNAGVGLIAGKIEIDLSFGASKIASIVDVVCM